MVGINHERIVASRDKGMAEDWNADHKQTGNHDCSQFQFLNMILENVVGFPGGPVEGQLILRTDENMIYIWDGAAWLKVTNELTLAQAQLLSKMWGLM